MENKQHILDRGLHLTRTLDAPIELVWEVWTQAEHLAQWWGPDGFTNTISAMDVQAGGSFDLVMHGPDGTDYKNKSVFREIVPMKKIVYEHISGPQFIATVEFESVGDKTNISWQMLFETREEFLNVVKVFKADEGQRQNVIKLQAYLDAQKSKQK